ncbi:MAG TPA: carboxypeptidase-like regulatory domain-containing protein [Polyangiales bacterium]|nr:carboxypeptidase-like regulatory domain-containing protein [Polyangiales bacterium]
MRNKLAWSMSLALWASACASTETGNPPFIRMSSVSWYELQSVVVFEGSEGAVDPGGAEVEVRNERTREVARAKSQRDGSFRLRVAGTASDGYTMRAENRGQQSERFPVLQLDEDAGPPSDASLAMCEDQTMRAATAVEQAIADADRACADDSDCVALRPSAETSCFPSCTREFGSRAGRRTLEAAVASAEANICAGFSQARCPRESTPCEPDDRTPSCFAGVCRGATLRGDSGCGEARLRAADQLQAALDAAAQGCTTAADCTFVSTETECRRPCQTEPILRASEQTFSETLQRIDTEICAPLSGTCTRIEDGCAPPPDVALCSNGRCVRAP